MKNEKILILGGGLVGLATAWFLHKRGLRPEVLDRRLPGQESSAAGAGMLPLHSVAFDTPALFELSRLSYRLYPQWVTELQNASGLDAEWEESGSMGLLYDGREEANARALGVKLEVLGQKVEWLTGAEARRMEPSLNDAVKTVMRLPETVQIRPPALCRAAVGALRAVGVTLRTHQAVESLVVEGGRIRGVRTTGGLIEADVVVMAAGAWAADLLAPIGIELPVFPLRGQVLLLQAPANRLKHILFASGHYLVPRRGGELYVGSTLEKVGFRRDVTPEGMGALSGAALRMVPGLQPMRVSGFFAGFRPGSSDGHPFLGPIPGVEGLLLAAGHHTHGHLLAPATGYLLAQLIHEGRSDLSLEPFRLGRLPYALEPPWWVKIAAPASV